MNLPFRSQLEAVVGNEYLVRALSQIASVIGVTPLAIGTASIRIGTGLPEGAQTGNIGDLYLRTDVSTTDPPPIAYSPGVNPTLTGLAIPETVLSANTPTLFTKIRYNGSPNGWTTPGAWQHIVDRRSIETTKHNWNPHPSGFPLLTNTIVHWTGGDGTDADLTVTGLLSGYQGQLVLIRNSNTTVGASTMSFVHASGNSSYGNRFTNALTSADTKIGVNGYVLYEYDETSWRLIHHDQGASIAWTPIDSSGAGLSLTVTSARYTKVGNAVYVSADITYPVTANGANALLGGLPLTTAAYYTAFPLGYSTGPANLFWYIGPSGTTLTPSFETSGTQATNAQLSAAHMIGTGTYFV